MAPGQFSNHSFYSSATTSPETIGTDTLCFYSVPTSPARNSLKAMYDTDQTHPTTPKTSEDAKTGFIDFEFETSRRFNLDDYDFETGHNFESPDQQYCKESLPSMAFADELFCNGKVMPLKPPPRFQYGKSNENNSALSSPRSPTGILKFPFQRRSLWNDDFDPFMVALENVKQERREKTHRRSRSMSPLRSTSPQKPDYGSSSFNHQHTKQSRSNADGQGELNGSGPYSIWVPHGKGHLRGPEPEKQVQGSPIRLAEPKGVLFARRARLVKLGHEKPRKPNMGKGSGLAETQEGPTSKESEGTCTRGSKRQKIKNFLLRSASVGRKSSEDKQKDESETLPKRSYTRKFSLKSMRLAQYNEERRGSEVTKMTVMQYRPKLFLCMGYGTR